MNTLGKNLNMGSSMKDEGASKSADSIFENLRIKALNNIFLPKEFQVKYDVHIELGKGEITLGEKAKENNEGIKVIPITVAEE